jgi:hypothetical protein
MTDVRAYYNGKAFIPLSPVKAIKNQAAIVRVLDDTIEDTGNSKYLQFAGSLSDEDYREITEILKSTEQIDAHEW